VANVQSQGPVPAESSALISSCIRCSNEANSVLLVTQARVRININHPPAGDCTDMSRNTSDDLAAQRYSQRTDGGVHRAM